MSTKKPKAPTQEPFDVFTVRSALDDMLADARDRCPAGDVPGIVSMLKKWVSVLEEKRDEVKGRE